MGYSDDYDTDSQAVAIAGKGWLSLKEVHDRVSRGALDAKAIPDFPVPGQGWFRADKAYEILHNPTAGSR